MAFIGIERRSLQNAGNAVLSARFGPHAAPRRCIDRVIVSGVLWRSRCTARVYTPLALSPYIATSPIDAPRSFRYRCNDLAPTGPPSACNCAARPGLVELDHRLAVKYLAGLGGVAGSGPYRRTLETRLFRKTPIKSSRCSKAERGWPEGFEYQQQHQTVADVPAQFSGHRHGSARTQYALSQDLHPLPRAGRRRAA
jgi:hypothetical protein